MGGNPQLQMNGTTASAIHALPTSLPGQSTTSALTQKLAGVEDRDQRRTMLGELYRSTTIVTVCHDRDTDDWVASTGLGIRELHMH